MWKGRVKFLWTFLFLGLITSNLQGAPKPRERVLSFKSQVVIYPNGWLTVTETIRVYSLQQKIRHGIYRRLPLLSEIFSIQRNGEREDYHVVFQKNGKRIYIGQRGRFIPQGEHTYKLQYRAYPSIVFSQIQDEVFWNVTGHWGLPLDQVEVEFILPKELFAEQVAVQVFIGKNEAKKQTYQVFRRGNHLLVKINRPLSPKENLSISLVLPKGYLHPLSFWQKLRWNFKTWMLYFLSSLSKPYLLVLLVGFLGIFMFYLYVWYKTWSHLKRKTVIPFFEPPKGISPAAARFLWNMGWDSRCLPAFLLGMAAKKKLYIEEEKKTRTSQKRYKLLLKDSSHKDLTEDEKICWKEIWQEIEKEIEDPPLPLENKVKKEHILYVEKGSHDPILHKVQKKLFQTLHSKYGTYFLSKEGLVGVGVLLTLLVYFLSILFAEKRITIFLTSVASYCWLFGIFSLLLFFAEFLKYIKSLFSEKMTHLQGCSNSCAILWIPAMCFFAFFEIKKAGFLLPEWKIFLAFAFLFVLLHSLIFYYFRFPTKASKEILLQLEGFRMYLKTAEVPEMEIQLQKPKLNWELFQSYLPYAFALDVLKEWVRKFSSTVNGTILKDSISGTSHPTYIPIPEHFLTHPEEIFHFSDSCSDSAGDIPSSESGDGNGGFFGDGGGFDGGDFGGDDGGGW